MFWIRPETFRNLLLDVFEAMRRRGFRVIVVIAGHWSRHVYLPTLQEAGEAFFRQHPELRWVLLLDRDLVPDLHYPCEHAATSTRPAARRRCSWPSAPTTSTCR